MSFANQKKILLTERFGHKAFRRGQEEGIDALLEGRDLLMVLPTGGGKSLTYQLPTLLMEGTTIVISPLIALMQDQVMALNAQGMNAAMLSHTQEEHINEAVLHDFAEGKLSFLYLSPERLNTSRMEYFLTQVRVNFFVIDEAHCISEWGHEFRDDYRSLHQLKAMFPHIPVAAFTATATSKVREDIVRSLQLNAPLIFQGKIFRKNLKIQIEQRLRQGNDALLDFLRKHEDEHGIVYMSSRKKCEALSDYLKNHGINAAFYHAGMPKEERDRVFKAFVYDEVQVVVATIAFGMGIDKSNIRFVVHMSMPKTIENYYQEIGRAGRDGDKAEVLMYYGAEDLVYAKMRLEEIENEAYKRHLQEKLATMYRYVATEECRHQFLARYFEDAMEPCEHSCDNCLAEDMDKRDITEEAQKLLSCIYRTRQRFGKGYVVDVLRGSTNQKILENAHDELTVYGIGQEISRNHWLVIVDRLLETECLSLGEYHVLELTSYGVDVLKGKAKIMIASKRLHVKAKKAKGLKLPVGDYDQELFVALRELRAEIAKDMEVPAYIVFSDKTLKEMAASKPLDEAAMLQVSGIGKKKYDQYGEQFLERIALYM